jgi:hypothetical protein
MTRLRILLALGAAFAMPLIATPNLRADEPAAPPAPAATTAPAPAPEKLKTLPPGKHNLLENMTRHFGLTYDQELEIEPLLHDEESVTKPILGFAAFTPAEQKAMLLTIKLAARRQIRPLLTAEQQAKLDQEMAGLAKSGTDALRNTKTTAADDPAAPAKKGSGKSKTVAASTGESVTKAILAYSALTDQEKQTMIAKVKEAAQRPPPAPAAKPAS